MIKYLIENNCPINIDCFVMLAARYHPEYIIYMYENGYCPIDLRITNAAAIKCYKLLKYLLNHNFPHDITTWYNAVGSQELNSIKLLYKYNKDTTFMQQQKLSTKTCNKLASKFTCLKWAHENGFAGMKQLVQKLLSWAI